MTNLENSIPYQTINWVLGQNKDILKHRTQHFILLHLFLEFKGVYSYASVTKKVNKGKMSSNPGKR